MHYACLNRQVDLAKLLIMKQIDINVQDCNNGRSPLHLATIRHDTDMVRLLVENQAKVYLKDAADRDAIFYAKSHKQWDILELLEESSLKSKK